MKSISLVNSNKRIQTTHKKIPDGVTETVRYPHLCGRFVRKVVHMELRRNRAPGQPIFMRLLDSD